MKKKEANSYSEDFFKNLDVQFLIHELKDPISIIEAGARTLTEKQQKFGTLTPRQEKIVKRIARNAQKARDMLYGLLETGRSEAGGFLCNQFAPAHTIVKVLMDSLEIKAPQIADELRQYEDKKLIFESVNRFGVFLIVEPEVQNLEMLQDEVKFRQIVGNLIKNALHFRKKRAPSGGEIIRVRGVIGANAAAKSRYLNVSAPSLYTGAVFREFLRREGITVGGKVRKGNRTRRGWVSRQFQQDYQVPSVAADGIPGRTWPDANRRKL